MPLRPQTKWIALVILLVVGGIFWAWIVRTRSALPVDAVLSQAEHLDFVGQNMVNDGGSRIFDFHARTYGWFAVLVRHRSADFGARPEFQEIRLWRRGRDHLVLEPKSQNEQRLLRLLRSASINTNRWGGTLASPSQERLRWLIDRIEDRGSTW